MKEYGIKIIEAERTNQTKKYTSEHDNQHEEKELVDNAIECLTSYKNGIGDYHPIKGVDDKWGLGKKHNSNPLKLLAVAGALIVAEINRIERKNSLTT